MRLRLLTLALIPAALSAQGNPTNLWLVELKWTNGRLTTGEPVKLTADNGTNSQPAFAPDGKSIVFSAQRDTGAAARSDIYRIDLATRVETRITRTPENENSPTVNEKGEYVAVRWQPATLFKEFGPWVYDSRGEPARGVLRAPDSTGYYTPLTDGNYALTRPKHVFTLGLFDARTGAIVDVDSGLPALPAQRIPGANALSYVVIDSAEARHSIRRIDLDSKRVSVIGRTLVGRTAHAWVAGRNTILMARGNVLYARGGGQQSEWVAIATFNDPDLRNVSAYVVSPQGDKLILTAPKRLALATVLRDSLESGRSGAEVAAFASQGIQQGRFRDIDIAENGINALGTDRLGKKRYADAEALFVLSTALFPKSWRAEDLVGDAQAAKGDRAAALASWKKSLDLNPKATDNEKRAATATEKKISGAP